MILINCSIIKFSYYRNYGSTVTNYYTNLIQVFFELKLCDQWAPMGDYDENEQPLVSVYQTAELLDRFHWKNFQYMPEIVLITRLGATVLTVYHQYIPVSNII